MKFLILTCLLAAAAAQDEKISDGEEKACVGDYFGGGNLTSKCNSIIDNMEKELTAFLVGDTTFEWTISCIKESMRNYTFLDFFLHTKFEQETNTPSVPVQLQQISIRNAVQSFCRRMYGFDSFFEQILGEMKSQRGDEKYQCLYKYSIEKTIIDKSVFDFDTSDFDSVNCTSYFKKFDEDFKKGVPAKEQSPSKFDECVDLKNAKFNFLTDVDVFMAIGMFDLTELQTKTFRAMYMEWFSGGDRIVMECVRDVYKEI